MRNGVASKTPFGKLREIALQKRFIGNHIEAVGYVKNPEGAGTGILLEFRTQRHELQRLVVPRTTLVGDGLDALRAIVDRGYYYNLDCRKSLIRMLWSLLQPSKLLSGSNRGRL